MTTVKWWIGIFILLCVAYIGWDEYQSEIQIEKIRDHARCERNEIAAGSPSWEATKKACEYLDPYK